MSVRPSNRLGYRLWLLVAILCTALGFASSIARAEPPGHDEPFDPGAADDGSRMPDEVWLEGRLLAPCCWIQTLDAHESPLASELRREVRARLRSGEPPEAIEDALARRFGERIRAVPKGRDPRGPVALLVAAMLALALAGATRTVSRWRRAGRLAAERSSRELAPAVDDARYEARLDEELRALDD